MSSNQITLDAESLEGNDYPIHVTLPNGTEVTVLIPDGMELYFGKDKNVPFGLNLVCKGHYQ